MTSPVSEQQQTADTQPKQRKLTRRGAVIVAAILAIPLAGMAYASQFGGCDMRSKFCFVDIAGTRSEVVVAWLDGPEIYTQTYSG